MIEMVDLLALCILQKENSYFPRRLSFFCFFFWGGGGGGVGVGVGLWINAQYCKESDIFYLVYVWVKNIVKRGSPIFSLTLSIYNHFLIQENNISSSITITVSQGLASIYKRQTKRYEYHV